MQKFNDTLSYRPLDVEFASGEKYDQVLSTELMPYVMRVVDGREDFMILTTPEGFFQFYGDGQRFVAEFRFDFPDGSHRTWSVINPEFADAKREIGFDTPFGNYMVEIREIIPYDLLLFAMDQYIQNASEEVLTQKIPCVDQTWKGY